MIYIGAHATENIDDDYFGSGKYLRRAIRKYGKSNFRKQILYQCESEQDMYLKESSIVNEEFVKRKDTYNLTCGGKGGNMYGSYHDYLYAVFKYYITHNYDFELTKSNMKYRYDWKTFIRSCRRNFPDDILAIKDKLPKAKPQLRTCSQIWVTNGVRQLYINTNDERYFLEHGFVRGRGINVTPSQEQFESDSQFMQHMKFNFQTIIDDIVKCGHDVLLKYKHIPYTMNFSSFFHACKRFGVVFPSKKGKSRTGQYKGSSVHEIVEKTQTLKINNSLEPH